MLYKAFQDMDFIPWCCVSHLVQSHTRLSGKITGEFLFQKYLCNATSFLRPSDSSLCDFAASAIK